AAAVETRNHMAVSRLDARDNRILLTQEFREAAYCCKSALAIAVVGRDGKARYANEQEIRLDTSGASRFTLLIASAATFNEKEDVAAAALRQLDAAQSR